MSRLLHFSLYALVGAFYFANYFDWAVAPVLEGLKWASALTFFGIILYCSRKNDVPAGIVIFLPLLILLAVFVASARSEELASSMLYLFVTCLIFAASWLFANHIANRHAQTQFFDVVANIGRFVILSNLVMWVAGLNLGRGGPRFSGWTDNPNTLALMMAPAMIVLAAQILERRRGWQLWSAPVLLIGLFLLLLTDSRGGMLWVAMAALAFFAYRQGVGLSFWISVVLGALALYFWGDLSDFLAAAANRDTGRISADVLSGRSEMWEIGAARFFEKPLTGFGPGMSETLLTEGPALRTAQGVQFHNSYLTVLVETGVVGAVAVLLVVAIAILSGVRGSSLLRNQGTMLWPSRALPWVILVSALGHAFFETWFMSPGNANTFVLWTCVWILVNERAIVGRGVPSPRSGSPRAATGQHRATVQAGAGS
jgi:O-antigen ligase